jgi:glucose/arabinose dehydrogenase
MERRRHAVLLGTVALVASSLGLTQEGSASEGDRPAAAASQHKATLPTGFRDTTAIGGLSEPVSVAFAPDGTAFVALKTGAVKSFDYQASTGQFEPAAQATDFADLSVPVNNYGDRGMTGIVVDPQFPARPYVYVNYTYNKDPGPTQGGAPVPRWGVAGVAYDECGPGEANIPDPANPTDDPTPRRGCPVTDRVSRLTAHKTALGWTMTPGSELVLVQNGCVQFASHASGDVAFGPDGKLYASAGDGASYLDRDYGQANNVGYPQGAACPDDPTDEGGALRAQDQRTGGDALSIDGTIFRLNPDAALTPTQGTADQWLVALGQRNPWRLTFRQGKEQLWSVDVGSSNWEEINYLLDAPTTGLVNRGWPCYEGTTGVSQKNAAWDALDKPLCEGLYTDGPGAVQAPVFAYRTTNATRSATEPLTPGENCPAVSSSMSGVAFAPLGTDWPAAYQDALFFSDFLRGCIWRMEKDANGQPNPHAVRVFAQTAGAPVDLTVGPGGDLYYVDYGGFAGDAYAAGSGGVHRLDYTGPTGLTVKSAPKKVKIKVAGKRHKTPYRTDLDSGTTLKLVAPRVHTKNGVRYVFVKWKGVSGKAKKKRQLVLTVRDDDLTVKAVYKRVKRRR